MRIGRDSYRLAWVLLAPLIFGLHAAMADLRTPTPEEYVEHVGGDATIVAAGEFKLDGYALYCGTRPTVVDSTLDDYGAAYPGYLIMNLKLLARVSTPVKLWIYSHECGHQFRGPDEATADCFAVQRGTLSIFSSASRARASVAAISSA